MLVRMKAALNLKSQMTKGLGPTTERLRLIDIGKLYRVKSIGYEVVR